MDFSFLIGGEAGQGIQSTGQILAKTLAKGGFNVFASQDFESRIRGGHNFFRIRASNKPIHAISEEINLIIALNEETITRHKSELKKNGLIIHDSGESPRILHPSPSFWIPFEELAIKKAGNKIMRNTVALGATLCLIKLDLEILTNVLRRVFADKGIEVVSKNIQAALAGFNYVKEHFSGTLNPYFPAKKESQLMLANGAESVALGALASDCKFMSGYPMTPSSGILHYFAGKSVDMNVVFEHAEDEIAALNMAIGASYAGARAMTATSGGGFSLMVEALSLAGMTETPVVIVLGQRPGPATGLPTRTEQSELDFAIYAGHGFFPRAVFAPSTPEECFYLTVKAFNIADKYQIPVIVLTDQLLADSYSTSSAFDPTKIEIDRGEFLSKSDLGAIGKYTYQRHQYTSSGVSPRAIPGNPYALVVTDSDEHTQAGHITESAETRTKMVQKRLKKFKGLRKEIEVPRGYGPKEASTVLISWGSTYGAMREAVDALNTPKEKVRMIHLSEIWPFPRESLAQQLKETKEIVVIESNATGQMAHLIKAETGISATKSILKFDGRPITSTYITRNFLEEAEN